MSRDIVIEKITQTLKRGGLPNMKKVCSFITSDTYQLYLEEGCWDGLLEGYTRSLGMGWYLDLENLSEWKNKSKKLNEPFTEYKLWNKLINERIQKRNQP
jgi:hypothetical protein